VLTPSASVVLGVAFVLVGGVNVWLVLEALSRVRAARVSSRMLTLHRIGGYLFIASFCVMAYFMIDRLRTGGDASPAITVHLALAMILSPLLFLKVLIARYYKSQYGLLMPLGLTIFVLAFALVAGAAGPHLMRASRAEPVAPEPARVPAVAGDSNPAADLMQKRCSKCHNLDRIYKTAQTPQQWRRTVNRMADLAADSAAALAPGEEEQIVAYLAATQTPEAVDRRKDQAEVASARKEAADPPPAARAWYSDGKTIGFVSLVGLAVVALLIRRPGARATAAVGPAAPAKAAAAPRPPGAPLLLELVQITPQTPDARTLRFAVRGRRKPDALPGQFLTFSFLFDGRKETRCYSICSSPSQSGYVEITPKRMNGGCVSVFLNDRAAVGMTVEATGPFGRFCLDPEADRRIVLLAAGSGITPMMAMLRYLDDLGLDTPATLLYCVRTSKDVIFRRELDDLRTRLRNFHYHVMLSRPEPDWPGARGHIDRRFVSGAVPEVKGRVFFLCGPPPFMEAARGILTELGVAPGSIRRETFGGAGAVPEPPAPTRGFTIEFARSGKTCAVGEGQTLLEAAAAHGVEIPSACRQGQCGTCKARLLAGSVRMDAEQGLDSESRARGFVLTCVGHAEGGVKLDA
jgi:ferredoxin-NADP reductase